MLEYLQDFPGADLRALQEREFKFRCSGWCVTSHSHPSETALSNMPTARQGLLGWWDNLKILMLFGTIKQKFQLQRETPSQNEGKWTVVTSPTAPCPAPLLLRHCGKTESKGNGCLVKELHHSRKHLGLSLKVFHAICTEFMGLGMPAIWGPPAAMAGGISSSTDYRLQVAWAISFFPLETYFLSLPRKKKKKKKHVTSCDVPKQQLRRSPTWQSQNIVLF